MFCKHLSARWKTFASEERTPVDVLSSCAETGGGKWTLQLRNPYCKVWSMAERERQVSLLKSQRQNLREVTFLAGGDLQIGAAWSRDFMGMKGLEAN